jgi:hypothetical protein
MDVGPFCLRAGRSANIMRLIGKEGFLDLQASGTRAEGTPGESDILLNVTVEASSYSAADQG